MNDEPNDKPKKEKIDILAMEFEYKLQHWLSFPERYPERAAAIRKKNRDRWLAEQKKKRS